MPIAAVPAYLGQDFSQASPGMRFGMFLKLWGINRRSQALLWETHDIDYEVRGQNHQEREVKYENKVSALSDAKSLGKQDKDTMEALAKRQSALATTVPTDNRLCLQALATAPFTTGLGNEHPLENGFAFLNPYGLPYLPGSGVKGVLRQAARELASGDWGDTQGWSEAERFTLKVGQETVAFSSLDALFGLESQDGDTVHLRGALSFWDVIPQIQGNSLMVEIMTPHQSHYYQNGQSPHDSGTPNPISFLTVPPGSGFAFHVQCDLAHLKRLAPELADNGRWKTLLTAAFTHAFAWLGFGAKTAVGYGGMQRDSAAEQRAAEAQAQHETEMHRAQMSVSQKTIDTFTDYMKKRHKALLGKPTRSNGAEHNEARQLAKAALDSANWTAAEKRAAADAIAEWLPKVVQVDMKDERKKLKLAALRGE